MFVPQPGQGLCGDQAQASSREPREGAEETTAPAQQLGLRLLRGRSGAHEGTFSESAGHAERAACREKPPICVRLNTAQASHSRLRDWNHAILLALPIFS